MKKVVIDVKSFLLEHSKHTKETVRISTVADKFGLSKQTFVNWEKVAPDVVSVLFYIVKENPETDVFKALCEWQKPPAVLVFIREFMKDYDCKFMDIVKEVESNE